MRHVLVLGLALMVASCGLAAPLSPGEKAPAFSSLPAADGKEYSSTDFAKDEVLVVAFTCNHCPFAKAYEDRFNAFAKEYADKGVGFIAINCNLMEADRLPAMTKRAEEKSFAFPYLFDESQEIGRAFGAQKTPQVFVLNKDREVVYVGAFDDNGKASKVEDRFVPSVVDALLAGETPEFSVTQAVGCGIKYE